MLKGKGENTPSKLLTAGKIFCAILSSTKGTGKTAKNARRYMDVKVVAMSATCAGLLPLSFARFDLWRCSTKPMITQHGLLTPNR